MLNIDMLNSDSSHMCFRKTPITDINLI